jgi:hypothetical protein
VHGHPRLLTRLVHLAYYNCGTFRFALHLPKEFPKTLVCGENEDWQEGGKWTTCTQDTTQRDTQTQFMLKSVDAVGCIRWYQRLPYAELVLMPVR